MDDALFDRFTRSIAEPAFNRRGLVSLLGGAMLLGAVPAAAARKKCPKKKKCGKDCCAQCFPKKNTTGDNPTGHVCCPKKQLCKKAGEPSQCCYPDEVCSPNTNNKGNGLCCRVCGAECCAPSFKCENGVCVVDEEHIPGRFPRRRGGG